MYMHSWRQGRGDRMGVEGCDTPPPAIILSAKKLVKQAVASPPPIILSAKKLVKQALQLVRIVER